VRETDRARRAQAHAEVGDALYTSAANEWAAVCWFYSAYHLVVAAIAADPVFDDVSRLQRISLYLAPSDRYTERHQGRRRSGAHPEWGINDLVVALYDQDVAAAYDKLHNASVEVRYQSGLRTPLDRVKEWMHVVTSAQEDRRLVCRK
jgi:hypothetical protein